MNFKEGDRVVTRRDCSGAVRGQEYEVVRDRGSLTLKTPSFPQTACTCINDWVHMYKSYKVGDTIEFIGFGGDRYMREIKQNGTIEGWGTDDLIKSPESFWRGRKLVNIIKKQEETLKAIDRSKPLYRTNHWIQSMSNFYWDGPSEEINKEIKPKKSIMKKLSNFIKKSVNADTQELLKAGLINGDLEPTYEGERELKQINWFANYDALVARAKEINAETEAESKK